MASKLRFLALLQLASCYRFFDSPFELPDDVHRCVEKLCRETLNARLLFKRMNPRALYCVDPCRSSLDDFLDNVLVACGDFKDGLWEDISETRSAMKFAESILWAWDLFCLDYELHPTSNSRRPAKTQDICKGAIYTAQKGDTCQSISKVMSVATDRLNERNGLTYTCSDLLAGRILCTENTCELMKIKLGQTCQDFVKWKWFSTTQLQSWNPTLKPLCSSRLIPNLDAVAGRYICIDPPGESNGPKPSPTQPVKGKWRIDALVSTKPSQTTMNSTPVTTTEPLGPYKTRLTKIDANPDAASSKSEFLKCCWLADGRWDYTLAQGGPPEDCQNLMDVYCCFHPERPSPTAPSSIPETCTPGSGMDEL